MCGSSGSQWLFQTPWVGDNFKQWVTDTVTTACKGQVKLARIGSDPVRGVYEGLSCVSLRTSD